MAGCRAQLNYSRSNGVCRVKRCDLGLVSRREMRLGALSSPGKIEGIIGASPWAGVFGNGTGLTGRSPGPPVLPEMGSGLSQPRDAVGWGRRRSLDARCRAWHRPGFCPVQGRGLKGYVSGGGGQPGGKFSRVRKIHRKAHACSDNAQQADGQNPEHLAASHDFVPQQSSELDCRLPNRTRQRCQ